MTLLISDKSTITERFSTLAQVELRSMDDFLPECTANYKEIEHLFAVASKLTNSHSAKSNYITGLGHFTIFLSEVGIDPKSKILDVVDKFSLINFVNKYIQPKIDSKELSPKHAAGLVSSVRSSLRRLKRIQKSNFKYFEVVFLGEMHRVTDNYRPYNEYEKRVISEAIDKDIECVRGFLQGYPKLSKIDKMEQNSKGQYLITEENLLFMFEEILDRQPVFTHIAKTEKEKKFLSMMQLLCVKTKKSMQEYYMSWGVCPLVYKEFLVAYALKMAQVTGLNADSILTLELNDYEPSHPATGKPCLRYWKERSTGEKNYHLDIFEAKLHWLTKKQSQLVAELLDDVAALTKDIRHKADPDYRNFFFLYESDAPKAFGEIRPLFGKSKVDIYKNFASKHELKNSDGEYISLSITRFRPTFVSELLECDVSIREIQLILGHSSIYTTMGYLDALDFNPKARLKITNALNHIHSDALDRKHSINTESNVKRIPTPFGYCKNVFNPPDFIKKLKSYVKGTPCSTFSKCLSCDNVIITSSNLPQLFSLRRDYLSWLNNNVSATPYGQIVEENVSILNGILDVEFSEFTPEELNKAEMASLYMDLEIV